MRTNRGLPDNPERFSRPGEHLEVQAMDNDGFWCVVAEPLTRKMAVQVADSWHQQHQVNTRVCVGERRDVIRTFSV
jgi:hypothetical protein